MGTELQRRGISTELPLWSAKALFEAPDEVRKIHLDYIEAGAEVITTNTFRTHRRTFEKAGIGDKAEYATRLAVRLAKEAVEEGLRNVFIAGSISPLEDCYRPDLSPGESDDEFYEIADIMAEEGVDFLLLETVNNLTELRSAIRASRKTEKDFWVSVNPSNYDFKVLLSGEKVLEAQKIAEGEGAKAFLVNCSAMGVIENAVKMVAEKARIPYGGYANNGVPDERLGWRFDLSISPDVFSEHALRLKDFGATRIGGCCGTSPEHIREAGKALKS